MGVGDQAGVGHAERLGDPGVYLVGPRVAGDLFDDVAEDDVVGVGVVVRAARFAHPSGRLGDGDQLGRRPLAQRVVDDGGLVEVLAEAAGVVEELAGRDPVGCGQVGQVAVDAGVEIDAALFGQLQHDDGDERLGGAADVPRHVGIDRPAGRVERGGAGAGLGDRAVGVAQRDAGSDELTGGVVCGQDVAQLPASGICCRRRRWGRRRRWRRLPSGRRRRLGSSRTHRLSGGWRLWLRRRAAAPRSPRSPSRWRRCRRHRKSTPSRSAGPRPRPASPRSPQPGGGGENGKRRRWLSGGHGRHHEDRDRTRRQPRDRLFAPRIIHWSHIAAGGGRHDLSTKVTRRWGSPRRRAAPSVHRGRRRC